MERCRIGRRAVAAEKFQAIGGACGDRLAHRLEGHVAGEFGVERISGEDRRSLLVNAGGDLVLGVLTLCAE